MVRWRKLKFEKVKHPVNNDSTSTKSICDSSLQLLIAKKCIEHELIFKNIILSSTICSVSVKCTKSELAGLSIDLTINENDYIKNITY